MHATSQTETMKIWTNARPRIARPSCAPAYYLARPASFWITATRRAGAPEAGRSVI